MEIVELSCKTEAGLDDWMTWLARRRESAFGSPDLHEKCCG
jgi:hypothetical protein